MLNKFVQQLRMYTVEGFAILPANSETKNVLASTQKHQGAVCCPRYKDTLISRSHNPVKSFILTDILIYVIQLWICALAIDSAVVYGGQRSHGVQYSKVSSLCFQS